MTDDGKAPQGKVETEHKVFLVQNKVNFREFYTGQTRVVWSRNPMRARTYKSKADAAKDAAAMGGEVIEATKIGLTKVEGKP